MLVKCGPVAIQMILRWVAIDVEEWGEPSDWHFAEIPIVVKLANTSPPSRSGVVRWRAGLLSPGVAMIIFGQAI